jgi:D-sedoheptulose 7-phosphate isomerase
MNMDKEIKKIIEDSAKVKGDISLDSVVEVYNLIINSHKKNEEIKKIIKESIKVKEEIPIDKIREACGIIINSYKNKGKLLVCGNGGSAADAQHMAGELVNKFFIKRSPLPCLALSTDTSILTSISNDSSFEEVFSKQVEAFGKKEDVLIGISTSGMSKNVINAVKIAKQKGIHTICLLGSGGILSNLCDCPIIINSQITPRIQEAHILIIHIICEIVERELFKQP